MIIKFNEEDVKNLNAFLDRVEMKGRQEALAMSNIIMALNKPLKEKEGDE